MGQRAKPQPTIYGYTLAGEPITTKFETHRGHIISTDAKGVIQVAAMGHRMFKQYRFATVAQARAVIDAWVDNDQRNLSIFAKMNAAFDAAAQQGANPST